MEARDCGERVVGMDEGVVGDWKRSGKRASTYVEPLVSLLSPCTITARSS